MKKFYAILCLAIASLTQLHAQAPQGFNYQATVRNSSGDLIVNTNVYFKFNVIQGSQTAVPIFTETHYVPTDDLGQVNLVIGQGTADTGVFSELDWSLGSYYLGIELDTGSGYVAMGTTQLLSVPYALYAENSGNSTPTTPNLEAVLAENNSANNQQIKDLQDPTEAQDAVTKAYIDAQIAEAVAGLQNQIDDLESDSNLNLNLVGSWYGTSVDNSQPPTTEEIQIILESDGEGHTIFDRYDQDNNLILEREYDVTWSSTSNTITINYFDYGPNGQQYIDSQTNSYEFIDTDSVRFIEDDGDVTILYRGIVNPAYTVEGKWLWSPDPDDRTYANTMFEFVDGNVYTSYANCGSIDNLCTDADFNALDATDRIPGVDTYTFDGNTLTWDDISRAVSFECDGGVMLNENSYKLWRLNSDCQ